MTDDDVATVRACLTRLSVDDPGRRRFGARRHGYALRPPLSPARVAAVRAWLGDVGGPWLLGWRGALGDGGAGPYHGLFPLDHPLQRELADGAFDPAAPGRALYRGVIGLGHLGCGQLALLVVGGPHRGQVWLDARAGGVGVIPVARNLETYVAAWLQSAARNQLPVSASAPGACPLARQLSAHLAAVERARDVASGSLDATALREVFAAIEPGALRAAATGDDPFFARGDALDPCVTCEVMLDRLAGLGLARDRVAEGEKWPADGWLPGPAGAS